MLLKTPDEHCLLTVDSCWRERALRQPLSQLMEAFDPRRVQLLPPAGLFERQQERLPPILLSEGWMAYDEMPWASPFSLQTQLKRSADIGVAASLLLLTAPLLLIAMLMA